MVVCVVGITQLAPPVGKNTVFVHRTKAAIVV